VVEVRACGDVGQMMAAQAWVNGSGSRVRDAGAPDPDFGEARSVRFKGKRPRPACAGMLVSSFLWAAMCAPQAHAWGAGQHTLGLYVQKRTEARARLPLRPHRADRLRPTRTGCWRWSSLLTLSRMLRSARAGCWVASSTPFRSGNDSAGSRGVARFAPPAQGRRIRCTSILTSERLGPTHAGTAGSVRSVAETGPIRARVRRDGGMIEYDIGL
jgi:hypothetical protein